MAGLKADESVARSSHPKHTLLVNIKGGDVFAGESVRGPDGGDLAVLEAIQPAAFGADPKAAVRILGDGADDVGGKAVAGGEYPPGPAIPARQAVLGAGPNPVAAILIKGGDAPIYFLIALDREEPVFRPAEKSGAESGRPDIRL